MSGTKVHSNYEDLLTFTRASKGHALRPVSYGDELVDNGDFSDGTTGWTANRGSISESSGELVVTSNNADYGAAVQSINVKVGAVYYISVDVKSASATPDLWIGTTWSNGSILDASGMSANSTYTNSFIASASTIYITLRAVDAGTDTVNYDNISVKEVTFDQPDGTLTLFEHPDGVPRVEWDADRNRLGLLVEEARTNLVTRSESFDNSAWTQVEGSITADAITAPDGTSTADFFVPSTNNVSNHLVRDSINVSSAQHSWSVFAKAGGYNWIRLIHDDGDDVSYSAYFDISGGVVGAVSGSATASIVDVGNGWYRCSVTASAAASASSTQNQFIYVAEGNGDVNFAGNGTSGVYLWGAQLEVGAFPTSYIKSNSGSTTTRSADVASIPVSDFGFNADAGSLLVSFDTKGSNGSTYPRPAEINDGTGSNRIAFWLSPSNNVGFNVNDGGVNQGTLYNGGAQSVDTAIKSAGAYKLNDLAHSTNGTTAGTDTSATIPAVTTLRIGSQTSGQELNGHIKKLTYYPRRLTNAQLVELTS